MSEIKDKPSGKMSNLFGDSDEDGQILTPPESKSFDNKMGNEVDQKNGRKESLSDGEIIESDTEMDNKKNKREKDKYNKFSSDNEKEYRRKERDREDKEHRKRDREEKRRKGAGSGSDSDRDYKKRDKTRREKDISESDSDREYRRRDREDRKKRIDNESDEDLFDLRDHKHSYRVESRYKKDKHKDRHKDKHKSKKRDSDRSRDRNDKKRQRFSSDREFDDEKKRRKDDKERYRDFDKNGTSSREASSIKLSHLEEDSLTPELPTRKSPTPEIDRLKSLTPEYRNFEESLKNIEENAVVDGEESMERSFDGPERVGHEEAMVKENNEKLADEVEPYDPEEDLEVSKDLVQAPKPVEAPKNLAHNGDSGSRNGKVFELKKINPKPGRKLGKTEIGTLVVKLMTPAYVERRFESRDLFKALARQISHAVVDKDEKQIKEYVVNFLKKNSEITSKTTI